MLRVITKRNVQFIGQRGFCSGQRAFQRIAEASSESHTGKFVEKISNPYTVTTYSRPNLVFTHGKGTSLFDLENNEYIDFSAGIAVTGLGHSNPEIADIVADQAKTLLHCSNLFYNVPAGELAHLLVTKTKASGGMHDALRVFLCNSGTEANEAALKFARKYGKTINDDKIEIICFKHGFHGRSMGALSVTSNPKYQKPFSPLIPGIKVANVKDIDSVKKVISNKTCGVIIEPIQGEGGVQVVDQDFLVELKKLCVENDAILIHDEIQCGLGRTGKLWAHADLPKEAHPDVVTMAKALGNGFPIGATMVTEKVEKALQVGDHGTTYGGNPLASRIGCYVVETISDSAFLEAVSAKSELFVLGLKQIAEKHQEVTNVFGKGLLLGLQLDESIPAGDVATRAREYGLVVITAGLNVVRLVPALNIDDKVIGKGLEILGRAIEDVIKESKR